MSSNISHVVKIHNSWLIIWSRNSYRASDWCNDLYTFWKIIQIRYWGIALILVSLCKIVPAYSALELHQSKFYFQLLITSSVSELVLVLPQSFIERTTMLEPSSALLSVSATMSQSFKSNGVGDKVKACCWLKAVQETSAS